MNVFLQPLVEELSELYNKGNNIVALLFLAHLNSMKFGISGIFLSQQYLRGVIDLHLGLKNQVIWSNHRNAFLCIVFSLSLQ